MAQKRITSDRWRAFMAGELTVNDLDEDEIYAGRLKSKRGVIEGRPPQNLPRRFHQDLVRELLRRVESEFRQDILEAVRHLRYLAFNADKDDVQLKATLAWIERVLGPVTQKVDLTVSERPQWELALEDLLGADGEEINDPQLQRAREDLRNDPKLQLAAEVAGRSPKREIVAPPSASRLTDNAVESFPKRSAAGLDPIIGR